MLRVRTRIGPSAIEGIGLFAAQDIPAGALVWAFDPGFDLALTPAEFGALPETARAQIDHYLYANGGKLILCVDDARFFNHAPAGTANCRDDTPAGTWAARDIAAGEELTCDYAAFDERFRGL